MVRKLDKEYKNKYNKKDIVSPLILIIVGLYLYANEINYIDINILYFSLIVLILGVILLIKSLME